MQSYANILNTLSSHTHTQTLHIYTNCILYYTHTNIQSCVCSPIYIMHTNTESTQQSKYTKYTIITYTYTYTAYIHTLHPTLHTHTSIHSCVCSPIHIMHTAQYTYTAYKHTRHPTSHTHKYSLMCM